MVLGVANQDKSLAHPLEKIVLNVECIGTKASPKAKCFSPIQFVADRD